MKQKAFKILTIVLVSLILYGSYQAIDSYIIEQKSSEELRILQTKSKLISVKAKKKYAKTTGYSKFVIDEEKNIQEFVGYNFSQPHDFFGQVLPASAEIHHYLTKGNGYIFNHTYITDQYGRRTGYPLKSSYKKAAIFFGCSMTFGHGVAANETIPYYFSKAMEDYESYNYALGASSTHYALAQIEFRDFNKEVGELPKLFTYVYIADHLYRNLANTQNFYIDLPYYEVKGNDVVYKGTFATARKNTNDFYRWWMQTKLFTEYGINLPLWLSTEEKLLPCLLAEKANRIIQTRYPNSAFLFVFHPDANKESEIVRANRECLAEKNINFVQITSDSLNKAEKPVHIESDGHLNALGNEIIAKDLIEAVKKIKLLD